MDNRMMRIGRFDQREEIGRGSYGTVFKARDLHTNRIIAMKTMNVDLEREGVPTTTLREVALLKELTHRNIVTLYDVVMTDKKVFLIFEYLEKDLRKVLTDVHPNAGQIRRIMSQLFEAIVFCHSRRFMHRDLKPENILLDNELTVKVADFGLARAYQIPGRPYSNEVQSLWYRAPEILLGCDQYSISIDIWSIGCIFAELFTWRPIFRGTTAYDQIIEIFKILGTPTEESWPGVTSLRGFPANHEVYPGIPLQQTFPGVDNNTLDLLRQLLTINPNKRISARAALSHPYFTSNN